VAGGDNRLIELGSKPTDPSATVKDLPTDCSDNRGGGEEPGN